MRPIWRTGLVGIEALAVLAGGLVGLLPFLGEELGPEPMRTAPVTGVVLFRDRPVGGGWVELIPAEGTVGNLRSAPLRPDGTFRATRVAVGQVAVRLVNPPAGSGVANLFRRFASPIRRTIPDSAGVVLDINLRDEELRYLRDRRPG